MRTLVLFAAAVLSSTAPAVAQAVPPAGPASVKPWDYGVFVEGGTGTVRDDGDHFFSAGLRAGKVLTAPAGPAFLRGQFEAAVEVYPFWQAYQPKVAYTYPDGTVGAQGGTATGVSITPINLRWNFTTSRRFMPWIQGAGGVVWTTHKFPTPPPDTSVWNFTPQFGIGTHYFLNGGRRSLDFSANAVHISSASLGDHNPGVNAAVMFTAGYSWWK